jgi:hypothetical protein
LAALTALRGDPVDLASVLDFETVFLLFCTIRSKKVFLGVILRTSKCHNQLIYNKVQNFTFPKIIFDRLT